MRGGLVGGGESPEGVVVLEPWLRMRPKAARIRVERMDGCRALSLELGCLLHGEGSTWWW